MPNAPVTLNTDQLMQKLAQINEKTSEAVKKTIAEHLPKVEAKARSLAPVASGLLASAIETRQSKGGHYGTIRINESKAPHGHLIEYGTVNQAPNPFLHQARDSMQAELKANLQKNIEEALKDEGE